MNLEELNNQILKCEKCALSKTRTNVVPGEGNSKAEIMFIGEGPGKNEDEQGRPFVGAAGKLLDKLIELIGLTRKDIYIANVVKCRPPGNRDPLPEEVEACRPWLDKQIETKDGSMQFEIEDTSLTPEQVLEGKETQEEVQDALSNVSEKNRVVVVLRDIKGFSYSEISDIIDVPVGTIKSRINRGRQELKSILINKRDKTLQESL